MSRKSNRLQMSLQRQHLLLSYLKTLSVGLAGVLNPRPPAQKPGAQPTLPTGRLPKPGTNERFGFQGNCGAVSVKHENLVSNQLSK